MENLEFILGILTTIGIFGLGYAIVGVFKVKTETNNLTRIINDVTATIDDVDRNFNSDLTHQEKHFLDQIDEIYRSIDSRFYKFENKLNK